MNTGPIYGVELIDKLTLGCGMLQQMPSRKDLELTRRVSERTAAGYEVLLDHYRRAMAIVDRLPKTADGVPITLGSTVWIPCTDMTREKQVVEVSGRWLGIQTGAIVGTKGSSLPEFCYSTREAAEAARVKQ